MNKKLEVTENVINGMSLVDKKTMAIINTFMKEEEDFVKRARSDENYNHALRVFSKGKDVKRLCNIIRLLYLDLKNGLVPFQNEKGSRRADLEMLVFEKDIASAKLAILLAIDSLNSLYIELNKNIHYDNNPDHRRYGLNKLFYNYDESKEKTFEQENQQENLKGKIY